MLKNSNSDKKEAPRRKKSGIFFEINIKEVGSKRKAHMHHRSLSITCYFFPTINHDDHPDPIFRRLYLGPQPRYKPSVASFLSPTPLAIDGCPPIISLHHGLLLRKQIPTPARNQLFCAASAPFRAFAQCPAFVPLGPAFE
jgi:hypothetical protein